MNNQGRGEHHVELSSTNPVEVQHKSHSNRSPPGGSSETKPFMDVRNMITKILEEVPDMTFLLLFVIGLMIDPLFLYLPFINDKKKCIGFDEKMGFATTFLRSLVDLTSVVYSVWRFQKKNLSKSHLIINILAVLPIPQVLLALQFRMGSYGHPYDIYFVNFFLAAPYVPRFCRFIKLYRKRDMYGSLLGVLSLYFLTSHVLGAFWYFFSIQRVASCWYQACSTPRCKVTYYCSGTTPNNITVLNQLCSINPSNASTFDFGIFHDAFQSGITGPMTPKKLYYSFWWGLRNLSNFGTNLQTSPYLWEIYFAVVISISGLFLLTIVIGTMQIMLQYDEERRTTLLRSKKALKVWMHRNGVPKNLREEIMRSMVKKVEGKDGNTDLTEMASLEVWLNRNGVPENLREEIMRSMVEKVEGKDGNTENLTDLGNLFSILPSETQKTLKRDLCMSTLTKVPRLKGLKDMDVKVLEMMCDYLKPVVFTENSWVVKIDEQLDRMLLITKGTMLIYPPNTSTDATLRAARVTDTGSSSMIRKPSLKKGDIYGDEELLSWASSPDMHVTFANLPISKENVKCHSKVEGFALTANDLKKVISKLHYNPFSYDAGVPQLGTVGGDHKESDQDSEQSDG
ncbi:cyclic nucleotide-gated ion channel 1-like [Rosa rugosa]|uniref:cyclic nucleotide-gated ion channel 1-like n=1 Tax=Rosa rugosa TaxID=74645 RepID=UPI002B416157|nr:cyclic nucleotide-gated ion channel 1-like [Rosa rugosa]XP_061995826.1 cyclic nucleotide-gated ion channel 1-like [Rosa rugosa]XP_061995827.1 cyclic nucleotide-gated ion channel 1-like [Rosa rugosa]XP_061995828.1 cyclic nucleotide-gated ion channel 1-like [Rosa rugosa]